MKFNHLVEINMPDNPLVMMITREQLWHGLVLRAEMPSFHRELVRGVMTGWVLMIARLPHGLPMN